MTRTLTTCTFVLSVASLALFSLAGPLNPPAGAVSSTAKPLAEIEPRIAVNATNTPGDADSLFKITQPGSYYLTGNITGVVGKHGIEIVASGVTLDLNGFDLVGVAGMGAFDGVSTTLAGLSNIAVFNGSVRNWGRHGIDLGTFAVTGCRIEGVRASGNVSAGVYAGVNSTVAGCSASGGQYGIYASIGSALSDCSAKGTSVYGLATDAGSTLTNCSAYNNAGLGISTSNGCTVTHCSAYLNTGSGISVSSGSTVEGCTARSSTLDGIVCIASCVIRGNTCSVNGNGSGDGAGIRATSADNRIEGNTCTGADRGIDVDAAGNIIIRNPCSGNTTNWDIAAGNAIGPIVVAGSSAVVTGNGPAASSLGSTDPNANYSY